MLCHKFKSYFLKKYFKSIPSPWDVQHFPTAIASGHLQGQLWVLPVHPVGFSRISIHESLEISWDVQVCYRLADPKCQCLSCSALAIYKLFQEITKASPALRQGWNPRLGTERWHLKNRWQKQCLLGTHYFLTVLAMKLCFEDFFETICEQRSLFSVQSYFIQLNHDGEVEAGGRKHSLFDVFQRLKKAILIKLQDVIDRERDTSRLW